jgi:hypothetical protein
VTAYVAIPLIDGYKMHTFKDFKSDTKNICTANLIIMLLVSMGFMLNKTEEEIEKLREEQLNYQSGWFFTRARTHQTDSK